MTEPKYVDIPQLEDAVVVGINELRFMYYKDMFNKNQRLKEKHKRNKENYKLKMKRSERREYQCLKQRNSYQKLMKKVESNDIGFVIDNNK